jgi:hypothetical protein
MPMRQIRKMEAAERIPGGMRNARSCRLSEGDTPSVLEGGPGLKWVPPVDSVVQQQAFQE